ncbi:MAG: TonB-dependent receptor [Gemmatimonadota bacterium]
MTKDDFTAGRRGSAILVVLLALLALAPRLSAQTDVIRGKVTNFEGLPLQNVRVTATSIPGNVVREVRTGANGSYQIAFPGNSGDYIMGFARIGYLFRTFEVKRLADEEVLVADARMNVIALDTIVTTETVQQRVNRNQQTQDVSGTERNVTTDNLPPELQGDLAAMAASLPGVLLVAGADGAADGFSVLGLGADANTVTLNGVQSSSSSLPRDAAVSTSLSTSPYDVSRGGFSGANLNVQSRSGSNFKTRGTSVVFNAPPLMWSDNAASALGTDYTNVSWGGVASGPLVLNKSFYNLSYQLGRNSRDNQTILNTNALGLETAGIAMDSVERFLNILQRRGVPTIGGGTHSSRVSDNGSAFGSIDYNPPSSTAGNAFNLTFNGNWSRQSPVTGGVTSLASSSGDRFNWGGGVQGRHSGYIKLLLSETTVGVNASKNYGSPYLELPSGRVRVNSLFDDGTSGVQSLAFGGNQTLSSSTRAIGATAQNTLSWFDDGNKHRIKLSTEAVFSGNTQDQSSNLFGSFFYNSLADLEAGIPASFTRTLAARQRTTGQASGSMALGDTYRYTPDLQIQYGVRVDASAYTIKPAHNDLVSTQFGRNNDAVPSPILVSPRIGFSWTTGQVNEITAFFGAARTPRAVVRGGIGVFASNLNAGAIGSALDNTGLPGGTQQIVCTGPAVPSPDWTLYTTNPAGIPNACADGTAGSVFSNTSPSVTLFSPDFKPAKSVRSNLSWNGTVLDARFSLSTEATLSLNMNQQRTLDLNFAPNERFTLDDGRPVYVMPTSIVTTTGSIASRDARVSPSFNRVNELRSDLSGRTAQLMFRLSPISRVQNEFGWSLAYTYSDIREQYSGFQSTASNPLLVESARSAQGPHQITYSLRYSFFDAVHVNWNGNFRSGNRYTPMISGDVNGDGSSNDRAFIYNPSSASDPVLAAGMKTLLANSDCLSSQLGRIADRNSCKGPWSSTASLQITLDRAKFHMPQRANVSFSLSNPIGAADLLVNGANNIKGWGMSVAPDPALLYVRGFDPSTNRYKYEVNQRFGATSPQLMTFRNPVVLTLSFRYDLGATREWQRLEQSLDAGRSQPGARQNEQSLRQQASAGLQNPMQNIMRQQDTLQLTAVQADSIASMNRDYLYRTDSLWTPIATWFAKLPEDYNGSEVFDRYLSARHAQVDMLMEIGRTIQGLLTAEQKRKLPAQVLNSLDPLYLQSIRNGTGLYVGGGTGGGGGGGGFGGGGGGGGGGRGPGGL